MKVLQIIESAYRATIEEQDDTIVWITHAMTGAGGDLDVVLRGDAVNYAVSGQSCAGISVGGWKQSQPPDTEGQLAGLLPKGVAVSAIEEDLAERGLGAGDLIDGIEVIAGKDLAGLLEGYDQIWHW